MSITQISIKRPTLVVVVFTALSLLGIMCYTMLKYELFPKMDIPYITVVTQYPGASANEVENSVTKNLEDALSALERVKNMSASSQEGVSSIAIELEANTNTAQALQDAQRLVNAVLYKLPTGVKTPSFLKFSSEDIPIIKFGISSNLPSTQLYQLVKDQIKSQLAKIDGVGQVYLIGGDQRQINININKDKLKAYNLSVAQVFQAVSNSNAEYPTGNLENTNSQYTIRLSGKVPTPDVLNSITVAIPVTGSPIKLSDVAEVNDGTTEAITLNRINGNSSIGVVIQKQSDANSVKVCKEIKEQMAKMEKMYSSQNLKFSIASDNSVFTLESANAVMEDLALAIILVAVVMFFFLHSFRNSLIVLVSIPTSLVSVFTAMYIFDFSLNMLTLMALSLVIGILVDDSIVVLENVHRHLSMGKNRMVAALDGRSEIGFTAVAITMVDVVVFVPMALVSGMIGNMLKEFSMVVVFSTLMSLFVSFTVVPLLASRFSKIEKLTRGTILGKLALGFEDIYKQIVAAYEGILRKALYHKKIVYSFAAIMIVGSFGLLIFGFIGTEFMPNGDRGEFVIAIQGDAQNTLYKTNQLTEKVEELLRKKPEVVKLFSNVGYSSAGSFMGSNTTEKAEITVGIVPKQERKQTVQEYADMVKKEILDAIPGIKVTSTPVSMVGNADQAPIKVLLCGADVNTLYTTADSVMAILKNIPGTSDIELSVEKSKPEMQIKLDRDKMGILGISVADVGNTLHLGIAGNTDLKYTEMGSDYDINVQFDEFNREKIDDIGSLTVINNKGKAVELREFASITQSLGPSKLERYNRISSLTVKASVFGRPVGTVGADVQRLVGQKIHSKGVDISYIGQMQRQSDAFGSLFTALLAAIIAVYLVMVALYNSYLYPFVVLFSIPAAVIGAFLALSLTGETLSVFSFIGLIMLIGLVAKNAILIVDFTNKLKETGLSLVEALVEAGKERLRPILMTTIAMVFGMIPLAVSHSAGSESKNGLAWIIIGGLLSSLLLTLVLVPSVYMTMENAKNRLAKKFHRKKAEIETVAAEIE